MPNLNTFDIPVIGDFVRKYLKKSKVSVDPFARNNQWTTYTNDLNPDTKAKYHIDANDFIVKLIQDGIKSDCVIFDPPYSARQVAECYSQVGRKTTMQDTQGKSWSDWKSRISEIVELNGIVLSFGWNTVGMGQKHGFEIKEILLVCHGGVHNDTICMAEQRTYLQEKLF